MAEIPDPQAIATSRQRPRSTAFFVGLLLFIVISVLLFRPLMALVMMLAFSAQEDTGHSIAPEVVTRDVAETMMHWGVSGDIARRIQAINGFTETGGFMGGRSDWYEVELSVDLATELRASLPRVAKKGAILPTGSAPSWWPKWPSINSCYYNEDQHEYLILPDGGRRAWFLRDWP